MSISDAESTSSDWIAQLEQRTDALKGLSTTSSSKYDEFKEWMAAELGARVTVCFVSDLGKQWTARIGQALMTFPQVLVLLVRGATPEDCAERLKPLHRYVTGLHAAIVLTGDEGMWRTVLVTGTPGHASYEMLRAAPPTSAHAPRDAAADEPPADPSPTPDFLALESSERGELLWHYLVGKGALEIDEAIYVVAKELREDGWVAFDRLRRDGPLYSAIEAGISWCTRRRILFDRPRRSHVRAVIDDADAFTREHWRLCVMSAVQGKGWVDRDDLVRAAAEWAVENLGLRMVRLRGGGRVDRGIRSAINGLIRLGELERRGPNLLRRAEPKDVADPQASDLSEPPVTQPPSVAELPVSPARERPTTPIPTPILAPEVEGLRSMLGPLPGEAEPIVLGLLGMQTKTVAELQDAVGEHLREFEAAFEQHHFLDLHGAEELARQSRLLLDAWPSLDEARQRLAQAAILYFTESSDADDDFRIGGLRTDKAVMAEVLRAVFPDCVPTS